MGPKVSLHFSDQELPALYGYITSSTSQAMSSLARQRGKYCLVCHTQPWTDPTSLSPHAPSTACPRGRRACGWRSYTFQCQAARKIITQSDGEMGSKGQVYNCAVIVVNEPVLDQNSLVETLPRWQQTWAALVHPVQLHYVVHLDLWLCVQYCRDLWWHGDGELLTD